MAKCSCNEAAQETFILVAHRAVCLFSSLSAHGRQLDSVSVAMNVSPQKRRIGTDNNCGPSRVNGLKLENCRKLESFGFSIAKSSTSPYLKFVLY